MRSGKDDAGVDASNHDTNATMPGGGTLDRSVEHLVQSIRQIISAAVNLRGSGPSPLAPAPTAGGIAPGRVADDATYFAQDRPFIVDRAGPNRERCELRDVECAS